MTDQNEATTLGAAPQQGGQVDPLVIVTNHAAKRFKQRVGLPKTACQRHAEKAFIDGLRHTDVRGSAKRYLDKLFLEHRTANNMRVYGQFVYLFKGKVLVTVLNLPRSVRGGCPR